MSLKSFIKFAIIQPKTAFQNIVMTVIGVYGRYSELSVFKETFLEGEYAWLYNQINQQSVVVDIGSNVGDTAFFFLTNNKVKKLIGFEVDGKAFGRCKQIFTRLNQDRALFLNKKADLSVMNKILKDQNFPIAIKCDIEGGEYDIFREGLDLKKVYAIEMEYHYDVQKIKSFLESEGFTVEFSRKNNNPIGWNIGLLKAKRPLLHK